MDILGISGSSVPPVGVAVGSAPKGFPSPVTAQELAQAALGLGLLMAGQTAKAERKTLPFTFVSEGFAPTDEGPGLLPFSAPAYLALKKEDTRYFEGGFRFGVEPRDVTIRIQPTDPTKHAETTWLVDANGNQKFDDDPPVKLEIGKEDFSEFGLFHLPVGEEKGLVTAMHIYDQAKSTHVLGYRAEYGTRYTFSAQGAEGKVSQYLAVLADPGVTGNFRWPRPEKNMMPVLFYVDFNGDGLLQEQEEWNLAKPFTLGDRNFQIRSISGNGLSVEVEVSPGTEPPTTVVYAPKIGDPAPSLQGQEVFAQGAALSVPRRRDLRSDFKGKIVLVDFWQTTCGPCKSAFLTYLPKMMAKWDQKHFALLSVNVDNPPQRGVKIGQFLTEFSKEKNASLSWSFLHVEDPRAVEESWGVAGYPTYFIVDGDTFEILGTPTEWESVEEMEALIGVFVNQKK